MSMSRFLAPETAEAITDPQYIRTAPIDELRELRDRIKTGWYVLPKAQRHLRRGFLKLTALRITAADRAAERALPADQRKLVHSACA